MGQNPYPVEIAGPGGGPVKTAGDLTFTDPGNQPGGGSQPFTVVSFPFAFDTPGLLAGVPVFTPEVGEIAYLMMCSITTGWDGTTPAGWLYSQGDDRTMIAFSQQFNVSNPNTPQGTHWSQLANGSLLAATSVFETATPVLLAVDDGSGGDPGSTTGEGELVIVLIPAT